MRKYQGTQAFLLQWVEAQRLFKFQSLKSLASKKAKEQEQCSLNKQSLQTKIHTSPKTKTLICPQISLGQNDFLFILFIFRVKLLCIYFYHIIWSIKKINLIKTYWYNIKNIKLKDSFWGFVIFWLLQKVIFHKLDNFFIWKLEDVVQSFVIDFELFERFHNIFMATDWVWISFNFIGKVADFGSNFGQDFGKCFHIISDVKLVVIKNAFGDKTNDFLNFFFYLNIGSSNFFSNFQEGQIKERPRVDLIIKSIKELLFHRNQCLSRDFFMNNFFIDGFDFQWVNLFNFGSNTHRNNTQNMQLRNRYTFRSQCKVPIQQFNTSKVRFIDKLVWFGHLNHPIKHSSSEPSIN